MNELEFIQFIKSRESTATTHGAIGIGDDAAVVDFSKMSRAVITTDMLLEGVHFDLQKDSLFLVGRKAMAVNISDLAAMGARPKYAFVSLGLKHGFGGESAFELWRGLEVMAKAYQVSILGGDTNSWSNGLVINVCMMGELIGASPLLRSGAKVDDAIVVTGPLGGSLLSGRHLSFTPRVLEIQEILTRLLPTSAIDLSDGIATDLPRVLNASHVGAELTGSLLPISNDVPKTLGLVERLRHAMCDGEDFELLLTMDSKDVPRLQSLSFPTYIVGRVTETQGMRVDGSPWSFKGFEHSF